MFLFKKSTFSKNHWAVKRFLLQLFEQPVRFSCLISGTWLCYNKLLVSICPNWFSYLLCNGSITVPMVCTQLYRIGFCQKKKICWYTYVCNKASETKLVIWRSAGSVLGSRYYEVQRSENFQTLHGISFWFCLEHPRWLWI